MTTTATQHLIDAEQVKRYVTALITPGQVVEVRALGATTKSYGSKRTISGYFNDVDRLAASLKMIDTADGLYLTINPCSPELLARANNRLKDEKGLKTTSDDQIQARRWLPIDCDPERLSGIPANDDEHQVARDKAVEMRDALSALGWPEPIEVDSGNGAYLLYRVDLPADDGGLLQRVLEALYAKFSDSRVEIDRTVFNQARIMRLCGTWNCKGDGTEDRPHRMARIIAIPDEIRPVSSALLESLALPPAKQAEPMVNETKPPRRMFGTATSSFTMSDFIGKHSIETGKEEAYKGGMKWLLQECPFCRNSDHCACLYELPSGALGFTCSHNSCTSRKWEDYRLLYEPDAYTKSRQWQELKAEPTTATNGNGHHKQDRDETDFILECLAQDEAGDAELFAHLFRGKVIYDTTNSEWYLFKKHRWELDTCCSVKLLVSGKIASTYLQAAADINLRVKTVSDDDEAIAKLKATIKALTGRALALRKASRINNVLSLVIPQEAMHITADQWDRDPWILSVQNGVIDLRTGEMRDGQPEDYVRTSSPTKWTGLNTPAPKWEQTLDQILEDRQPEERAKLIGFLQRVLGYGITGLVSEEIFLVLYGEDGRNGKDTIIGRIERVLGPTAGVVSNDVFLSTGKFRTAGSATPHLVALQGKRIAWANEPEHGARFNAGQVKDLTGGSPIPARQNYGKQYAFDPTFLLLLLTNHKPHADAADHAFWSRLRMITFNMRFVDNPDPNRPNERKPDKTLKTALEAEASGILAWLVRGCLEWQQQGLNAPASVLNDGKAYQKEEDNIARFIDECCVVKEGLKARAGLLYTRYAAWCKEGNMYALNSTNFGTRVSKQFKKDKDMKGWFYHGVGLLNEGPEPPHHLMTGFKPSYGNTNPVIKPVSPLVEPNHTEVHDGYDDHTIKAPYMGDDNFKNRNFTSAVVIPVMDAKVEQPVEPYDGVMTGCENAVIAEKPVIAEYTHESIETLLVQLETKLNAEHVTELEWRANPPYRIVTRENYLRALRELAKPKHGLESAVRAEIARQFAA